MDNLFQWIKNIQSENDDIMNDESDYNQFIVNRTLAHYDAGCALIADEMNKYSKVSNRLHYDFLRLSTPKKKRFIKFPKRNVKDKYIDMLMQYYRVNHTRALEYIQVLSEVQLELIQKDFEHLKKVGVIKDESG